MRDFEIKPGAEVEINGRRHEIVLELDPSHIIARDLETGARERYAVELLKPPGAVDAQSASPPELDQAPDVDWDEARRRLAIIQPLLDEPRRPRSKVEKAAKDANKDTTTLYRWMKLYGEQERLSALLPPKRSGGRGKGRLEPQREELIETAITDRYLQRQRPTVKETSGYVARLCRQAGLKPPSLNTIRSRVLAIDERERYKRRGHLKIVADRFTARPGKFQDAARPLDVVQIDHTKLAMIVVDRERRLPIGRPWLTLVLDVYSRMILGFCLGFDPPSALTVGLALSHAILPKEASLERHGLDLHAWPCWGFPARILVDNGRDFHSKTLTRACEEYGIEIDYCPIAKPHFKAHVERMFRTIETALRSVPGTTFSNPAERSGYDSEGAAVMTLDELEGWLMAWITGVYHQRAHSGMDEVPAMRWHHGLLGDERQSGKGIPGRPTDEDRLRIDFLPAQERTIQTYGVRWDEINYYDDALRPYIAPPTSRRHASFRFRRDPRDISTIYFWDPELERYFAIPYRNTSHPPISIWELRKIQARLKEQGRREIDEDEIFKTLEQLESRQEEATARTRHVRRLKERKAAAAQGTKPRLEAVPVPTTWIPASEVIPLVVEE